jgi:hypothetical protein
MAASSFSPLPGVSIPLDILTQSQEEHIQLGIAAIQVSGTKSNGDPQYSVCQAAKHFGLLRSTLGFHLKGM